MEGSSGTAKDYNDMSREELIRKCKSLLVIVHKSKQHRTQLQNELDNYKTQIEENEKEKISDKENIKTLQELVASLTEQKLTYITNIDETNNKVKAFTIACNNYKDEIDKYKSELAVKQNELTQINNELSNVDSNIISLKRQNERLVDENEQLITQLSEMEVKMAEFNEIGLKQQEQLRLLEEKVSTGSEKAEAQTETSSDTIFSEENTKIQMADYETKIKNMTELYEIEKEKSDKVNMKLKSYRDKILKCAACINQLKNSRYILTNTVKEYSESIPKWQNEIIKASKFLDGQLNGLHNEIKTLKERLVTMEQEYKNIFERNSDLLCEKKQLESKNTELKKTLQALQSQNTNHNTSELLLQIKSLESEKSTLVREKMTAKDHAMEFERQVKALAQEVEALKSQRDAYKTELNNVKQENQKVLETNNKNDEFNHMKNVMKILQEQFDILKKEYENVIDLNGLLKEEVSTLRNTLERPCEGSENLTELNNSLQTDVVKLENKLSALKQENSIFSAEIKESRSRIKKYEAMLTNNDEVQSQLESYRKENSDLLHEMKEINQVFKARGEKISKQEKAIFEMERLIETMENDRDRVMKEKCKLEEKCGLLENELKGVQKLVDKHNEYISQISLERDGAVRSASEKDSLISSLRDEIEKLKQQQTAELPNEDMSTSTISKAEEHSRMKDLDDTFEDKYSKLRIFALKLKKKLNDTTNELQNVKKEKSGLEKVLDNIKGSQTVEEECTSKSIDVVDANDKMVPNREAINDLQSKLNNEIETAEMLKAEVEKVKAELTAKEEQLTLEVEAHKKTKDALDKTKKDVKKKSVLSLEMEDYERSMKELTTKMDEKTKKMIQLESTLDTQQGTITATKTQIKLLEDQIKTEEKETRLMKEELQNAIEELKEKDNVIATKNEIITKLEHNLEDQNRKYEEMSVEMTSLLGDKEKSIISLCDEKLELNNKVKRLEFQCAELDEKLKIMNIELEDLKTDYTSYKIRAQSVLRQNQIVDHSQEEQLKEENAALKVHVESVTSKLTMAQDQIDELKTLAETEQRRAAELANEASRAGQRTARLQADLAKLSAQLDDERTQHKSQVATITQCYKSQISELEMKLQRETEELKTQLAAAADSRQSVSTQDKINKNDSQYLLPVLHGKEDGSDGEIDINVSMLPREEGEGSEAAPSPTLSKQYASGGNRSPVPLERLLEEGVPDDEILEAASMALTPEQELIDLKRKLQAQLQRVKHVTVLLAESERECARYAQMNELLKAEVRRARSTMERAQHAHNAEYMKNVTLKFVMLSPGDERCRLVPVLQKILSLNPDETQKLTAVAKGMDPNPGRGWGSYLPWPGGSK